MNILTVGFLCIFITACTENKDKATFSGGQLSFPINSFPATWVPSVANDMNSMVVLTQIYEGLVEIDRLTYQVKPLLAKKIIHSDDYTTFSFELEENVQFQPSDLWSTDSDRVLTKKDVLKTFEYACIKEGETSTYAYQNILKEVKGAEDFHRGISDTIKGLYVDSSFIVIELSKADPLFLQKLASPSLGIFAAKWLEKKKGIPPGTGPFYLKNRNAHSICLSRHPDYFKKDAHGKMLPYLDEINFKIYRSQKDKISDFLAQKLDVINGINELGLNQIFKKEKDAFNQIPPKLIYYSNTLLNTTLVLFNLDRPIFESTTNRKLFNYAINREAINRALIQDKQSSDAVYGLIPPMDKLFNHYDYQQLSKENLNYNPSLVLKNKDSFKAFENDTLTLALLNTPQRIQLGILLQKQLKTAFNLTIEIKPLNPEQLLAAIDKRTADLFLAGFSAEFLHPLSLMKHFYGATVPDSANVSSTVNVSRYKNWYFDQFYEKASKETKPINQFNAILLAEKELLKNPPFIVLNYNADNYVQYAYVCDLYSNMLNLISFREVYIQK
jgi:peptide/nickel transport system substrate-binding protein